MAHWWETHPWRINQRERFLQPIFLQQLPVQEEAAALAVFFPGNVLRRDGVNAQLCQKQRLRAQISKRIRPDGSLALQNVHDGERGLVVHKGSLPHDHVPVGIGGILVRRQPGVTMEYPTMALSLWPSTE